MYVLNVIVHVQKLELLMTRSSFQNGVVLCRLMSVLRAKEIPRVKNKRRMSQIEASGNLALALDAMKQDGVKLVNIGQSDRL